MRYRLGYIALACLALATAILGFEVGKYDERNRQIQANTAARDTANARCERRINERLAVAIADMERRLAADLLKKGNLR